MYKRKYVYALIDLMEKESERGIGEKKKKSNNEDKYF